MGVEASVKTPTFIMLEKFRKIFDGLEERFGYHQLDTSNNDGKKSGVSFTSSYAHTDEMWKAHLEGKKFEVINIDLENSSFIIDSLEELDLKNYCFTYSFFKFTLWTRI